MIRSARHDRVLRGRMGGATSYMSVSNGVHRDVTVSVTVSLTTGCETLCGGSMSALPTSSKPFGTWIRPAPCAPRLMPILPDRAFETPSRMH